MEKIKKNILIACFLMQLKQEKVSVKEIIGYSKDMFEKLKGTKYKVDILDEQNIRAFFNYFPVFGKIKNGVIELNNKEKLKKFFLSDIDERLILLLKNKEKVILPVKAKDKLINYYLSINDNKMLDSIKEYFDYDEENKERYILDLNLAKKNLGEENIACFIEIILNNSIIEKTDTYECNLILECADYIDYLNDSRFKNIEAKFKLSNELLRLKTVSDSLYMYYKVASNNKEVLEQINNSCIKKLTKM